MARRNLSVGVYASMLALTLALAACARPSSAGPPFGPATVDPNAPKVIERVANDPQVTRLVAHLSSKGFVLEPVGESLLGLLSDAPGQAYRLNTSNNWLHAHVYDSVAAATAAASRISPTLDSPLGSPMMDWIARPHFFRCDRVIAAYLGMEQAVLDALQEMCGPPFAQLQINTTPQPTAPPFTSVEITINYLAGTQTMASVKPTGLPNIHLTQTLASGVVVLYSYAALLNGQPATVTRITYLDWRDPVWYPDCDNMDVRTHAQVLLAPAQLVFSTCVVNGGTDTPAKPDEVSFVGGEVSEPAVSRIIVTFEDGSSEDALRAASVYLAAKLDAGRVMTVRGLDSQESVVFERRTSN